MTGPPSQTVGEVQSVHTTEGLGTAPAGLLVLNKMTLESKSACVVAPRSQGLESLSGSQRSISSTPLGRSLSKL